MIFDAFGTQIKEGSLVVYATRRGSTMKLNKLRVVSVSEFGVQGYDPEDVRTRSKTLTQLKTIVVMPEVEDADV